MRRAALIIALGLLGLGALLIHSLGVSHSQGQSSSVDEQVSRDSIVVPKGSDALEAALAGDPGNGIAASPAGKPEYRQQFKAARDLWQFAETIYPAAMSGDAAAQYYLFRTLKTCFEFERFYFRRGDQRRTLDEALEWASTRPDTGPEDVAGMYEKCHRLQEAEPPFGDREEWLRKSQAGGFELAILEAAVRRAGPASRTDLPAAAADARKQARLLAVQALSSKDPEVIFRLGQILHLLTYDDEGDPQEHWGWSEHQWAWLLAACKRGHDCTPDAEWHRYYCRYDSNCQPSDTAADLVRRANPQTFDEIDRLSDQLNAKLDAGDFDVFESASFRP